MSLPPLPRFTIYDYEKLRNGYVKEQMEAYGQQCREAALEEAAESLFTLDIESYGILPIRASMVISDCNLTIRKLK